MSTLAEFDGYKPTWCPGCGNWGIGIALKSSLSQLGLSPSSVFVVFGIGCSGNMNDFLNAYSVHSLHGRSIPTAIGMKLANHKFTTLVVGGDGDLYGEGGNHFLHACRGNHDITVIVHDNKIYGLTTGQFSPTSPRGFKSKSSPYGSLEKPLNPLAVAISEGATFVAQGFAGNVPSLINIIKLAISHKGFSLVNVLQPCVSFNKINTYEYYRTRVQYLSKKPYIKSREKALDFVFESYKREKYPVGVVFSTEKEASYTEMLFNGRKNELVKKPRYSDFSSLFSKFEM